MVRNCCVLDCKSESYPGCGKSFHRFPKDDPLKKKWLDIIEKRHETEIIKCISSKYLTLRLRAYAKNETLKIMGHKAKMRQKLHKAITFSNV